MREWTISRCHPAPTPKAGPGFCGAGSLWKRSAVQSEQAGSFNPRRPLGVAEKAPGLSPAPSQAAQRIWSLAWVRSRTQPCCCDSRRGGGTLRPEARTRHCRPFLPRRPSLSCRRCQARPGNSPAARRSSPARTQRRLASQSPEGRAHKPLHAPPQRHLPQQHGPPRTARALPKRAGPRTAPRP